MEAPVQPHYLEWTTLACSATSMILAVCAIGRMPWLAVLAAVENIIFSLILVALACEPAAPSGLLMAFVGYLALVGLFAGMCLAFTVIDDARQVYVVCETTPELPPDHSLQPAHIPTPIRLAGSMIRQAHIPRPQIAWGTLAIRYAHAGAHRVRAKM